MTPSSPHSSATIAEAQRLAAGGWSIYAIAKLFRRRGIPINETTIAEWVDPARAERRRAEQAQRYRTLNARRTGGRLGAGPPRSPEFRLERMKSLKAAGVPAPSIAKVMNFDFPGERISADAVLRALRDDEPPAIYRDTVHRQMRRATRAAERDGAAA